MTHDDRLRTQRAFLAGVRWALKTMTTAATEGQDRALALFIAHEDFESGTTRRLIEGAMRVE